MPRESPGLGCQVHSHGPSSGRNNAVPVKAEYCRALGRCFNILYCIHLAFCQARDRARQAAFMRSGNDSG